ncbi:UNVERIFIED_CONTAM: hypothetical protein Scaly_2938900 [Sesamum calycinum]|uniref:DUF4283 domain-containing protein n=1 Tax=Sesamum calycinum TaxID=2727403 RepID=A0AAW2KWC2_9LAMI
MHKTSRTPKILLANSTPASIGSTNKINGLTTLIFSDSETQSLADEFKLALIGKFSHGSPPYSQLHRLLAKSGLKGAFTVSLLNNKHALISLSNESDYTRLWLRRIWIINGFPIRVFKWSPTFTPNHESSIVPIWVSLHELPAHLFRKDALFAIANNIGTPLQIANSTLNQSNLANARVCVEIDLLKPLLKEIDIQICGTTIVQNIVYGQVPNYCSLCKHVGHRDTECYSKGDAPKPPSQRRKFGKKNEVTERYKLKGKAVAQDVHKMLDKMTEKNITVNEVGECSKNAVDHPRYVSVAALNSQKGIVELPQPVCNDEVEISCAENDDFVDENDGFCVENDNCVVENDAIRVLETGVEFDGNGNVGCGNTSVMEADVNWQEANVSLDCDTFGFTCENEENATNLGEKVVGTMITRPNNIVDELRRGKKWISVDTAVGLIQNWKRFGVVIKGIKEDVEAIIKRNKLAVSSAIQFQKCVLLYDSVRQLNLKPLDTGEQFDLGVPSPEKPSPIASRTRCRLLLRAGLVDWAPWAAVVWAGVVCWVAGLGGLDRRWDGLLLLGRGWTGAGLAGSGGRGGLEVGWACRAAAGPCPRPSTSARPCALRWTEGMGCSWLRWAGPLMGLAEMASGLGLLAGRLG